MLLFTAVNIEVHYLVDMCLLLFRVQDEALSPESQLSPVSFCSESSGFSGIAPPTKKAPKRSSQTTRGEAAASSYSHLYT